MKIKKAIKKIIAVGFIGLVGMGALVGCTQDPEFTQADVNAAYEKGKASVKPEIEIKEVTKEVPTGITQLDVDNAVDDALDNTNITTPICEQIIKDAEEAEEGVDAKTKAEGYDVDDLKLGAEFSETISDRDIDIFDGELDFDGDDYDAEEIFSLTNLKIAINENDFGSDAYLQIPEDGLVYEFIIDKALNTSKIEEDETLEFDFLGETVEVIEWDGDTITFTKGEEYNFIEGIEQTIDGMKIKASIIHATDDSGYVKVYVDGVGKKIYEGSTKTVNGIEVKVVEVAANDETADEAILQVGEEVELTIEDGDEYAKDSPFEYTVTSNKFGLRLSEEFLGIDEDDDYLALEEGEELCLPKDYICVVYNGITEEDTADYDFELKTKSGSDYTMVTGDFLSGINDYDKIYIDAFGIYEYDGEMIKIDDSSIEIADTDLTLESDGTFITIDDIEVTLALNSLAVAGNGVDQEEDYITKYGIIIKDSEDSLKDFELELVIPDEELEASITVTSK